MQGESDEIRIINLLKEINLRIGALLSRFYDRYGLTPVQAAVALALYEHGQQNITDLCALMGCGKSNLSPLCRRLERRGFVERVRDEEDQRVVHIRLTAAALDSVSELHRAVKAERVLLPRGFPEEDRRIILAGLETLCRYLPQRPDSSGGFPKESFEMMDPCARKPAAPRTERRTEK